MIRMVDHAARPPLPQRHIEGVEHHAIDQPTIRRLNASSTTARKRKPAHVGIYVISATQHIGPIRCEVAVDEIGRLTCPIPHGRDGTLATAHAGQASIPHQPGHARAQAGRFTQA
jgi:hypothetical protein